MLTSFFAASLLRRRVPWPAFLRNTPLNPSLEVLNAAEPGSLPAVRLSYVLSTLPSGSGDALLRAAASAARDVWIADFVLPERNLCLPACWAVRLLPGLSSLLRLGPWRESAAAAAAFFRDGALFGAARRAGLQTCGEIPLCGMAASLVCFQSAPSLPAAAFPPGVPDAAARQALRRDLRSLRRAIAPGERARAARRAQKRVLDLPVWQRASAVVLYVALDEEMDASLLLQRAWDTGKEVFLPRVRPGEHGVMDVVRCAGPGDLAPGAFNLLEPRPSLPGLQAGDPRFTPSLMVLPGVGFDRSGHRLGFGGGYYDRFLASAPSSLARLGLCFHCQLLPRLPAAPWDQRVACVCTEEETLWI